MGTTDKPDWRPLAAVGIGLLAAALGRRPGAVHVTGIGGEQIVISAQTIVSIEGGAFGTEGRQGAVIRTDQGQIVRVSQSPGYVLDLVPGLHALTAARPTERRGDPMIHVRPSAITACKESNFRVVGRSQRDLVVSLRGNHHLSIREPLVTVQSLMGR